MSQIQTFISAVGPSGPIETLTGDQNLNAPFTPADPVPPTGGNINIIGEDNVDYAFAVVKGNVATSTLQIFPKTSFITTNDATITAFPEAVYPLATNTALVMSANIIGNRADVGNEYQAACGGYVVAVGRRDLGAAILVNNAFDKFSFEDAIGGNAKFGIQMNGNQMEVYVQGLAGQTWNWTCTFQYQVQLEL